MNNSKELYTIKKFNIIELLVLSENEGDYIEVIWVRL